MAFWRSSIVSRALDCLITPSTDPLVGLSVTSASTPAFCDRHLFDTVNLASRDGQPDRRDPLTPPVMGASRALAFHR
jgi:hypothetical protein